MVARGTFYGVVTVLVAALLVTSSLAVFYYYRYQDQGSASQEYADELATALQRYNTLSASFSLSLQDYKETLSLLADAVANFNTSTPAYQNASAALSSLWSSYQALAGASGTGVMAYQVSMLVDYGNGTRRWYNDSAVEPGWNAYVVTLVLLDGSVQAAWYPQYGEHFVTGLNGVAGTGSNSWFVWVHDSGGWTASQTGADYIRVHNGTIFAWTLCGFDSDFSPACRP